MQSREAHAVYIMQRYRRERAEAIEALGGKCALCSSTETLELDHQDPTGKSFPISKSVSAERRGEELKKCQVLCRKCHVAKTGSENSAAYRGAGNPNAILTEEAVQAIRASFVQRSREHGARALGRKFGVSHQTIMNVVKGVHWT